jgi:hypothetical protein
MESILHNFNPLPWSEPNCQQLLPLQVLAEDNLMFETIEVI